MGLAVALSASSTVQQHSVSNSLFVSTSISQELNQQFIISATTNATFAVQPSSTTTAPVQETQNVETTTPTPTTLNPLLADLHSHALDLLSNIEKGNTCIKRLHGLYSGSCMVYTPDLAWPILRIFNYRFKSLQVALCLSYLFIIFPLTRLKSVVLICFMLQYIWFIMFLRFAFKNHPKLFEFTLCHNKFGSLSSLILRFKSL